MALSRLKSATSCLSLRFSSSRTRSRLSSDGPTHHTSCATRRRSPQRSPSSDIPLPPSFRTPLERVGDLLLRKSRLRHCLSSRWLRGQGGAVSTLRWPGLSGEGQRVRDDPKREGAAGRARPHQRHRRLLELCQELAVPLPRRASAILPSLPWRSLLPFNHRNEDLKPLLFRLLKQNPIQQLRPILVRKG